MMNRKLSLNRSIFLLIREVKKHKCLWDQLDEKYNDRFYIGLAWKQIAEKLNMSERTARMKWKYLRDTFKRAKKKERQKADYSCKWPFYNELIFLEKSSSEPTNEEDEYTVEYLESSEDTDENNEKEVNEAHTKDGATNFDDKIEYFEPSNDINEEDRDKRDSDEQHDLMFLESLAPFMEKIDPMRKLVLRSRIQDMLLNEVVAQKNIDEQNKIVNRKRKKLK